MTRFVVVAGAWLGAWAWDEVVSELRAAGHEAHALTLSGPAEKQGVPAGQRTHVRDIVDEVERLGPRDVVLVGHSYSGVPVGQAAERIGDRLARAVFVDANVPVDGTSFLDGFPSDHIRRRSTSTAGPGRPWTPPTTRGRASRTSRSRASSPTGPRTRVPPSPNRPSWPTRWPTSPPPTSHACSTATS
ncbi:alpha/beta fold hydrolase [Streptomyces sp. SAS_260]|uniref:alpha/beta fold hydrolase n=1 Tax=Streptomyces sp. SAS_260 TaxID=3412751 RepID=UPI00403C9556